MKFEATLLKSDTSDANGRVYSKESLRKAVGEYNNRPKSPNNGIIHPCKTDEFSIEKLQEIYKYDDIDTLSSSLPYLKPIDFDIAWNDKFEKSVNKKVIELVRKLYGGNNK